MIPFHKPHFASSAFVDMEAFLINSSKLKDREATARSITTLRGYYPSATIRLTKSCTQSLELAALLLNIQTGDEVILPSFAYVSTATAFVQRGAVCRFIDIDPHTMNLDPACVEAAISSKTKAIVCINYAGIACDYAALLPLAQAHHIPVVEDNAMGVHAYYHSQPLGSMGSISTMSFDHLKNITCGEGGAIVINDKMYLTDIDVYYENGTNKKEFIEGKVERYEWKSLGSNYHLSELLAAVLQQQLTDAAYITASRCHSWEYYNNALQPLANDGKIALLQIPSYCQHNGHNFVIKVADSVQREALIHYLRERGIEATFHYIPLHNSAYGRQVGTFVGVDQYTTSHSERLLRLPLFYGITTMEQDQVISSLTDFFKTR